MPTYPVKNLKTEEKKELFMTMDEYEQWRKDNPDWDKDWSQGCLLYTSPSPRDKRQSRMPSSA